MRTIAFLFCLGGFVAPLHAQTSAEKLGYPSGKRVLMLHADDIGMCHEANVAAKELLTKKAIHSAAVMVPCPWFEQFATWYKENPQYDVGLHLTLTSEWKHYRWGTVAKRNEVPGLLDPEGYMWRRVRDVVRNAKAAEVEVEIRAQIEKAKSRGIVPGHLDTHMGTLYGSPEFVKAYLKVAEEYQIPAMVIEPTDAVVKEFRRQGYPFSDDVVEMVRNYSLPKLDYFDSVEGANSYDEFKKSFFELIEALPPGISEVIFHPSIPTDCLKDITGSWRQRGWEAKLFLDPEVRKFLKDEDILFTNWKEMMRRHKEATNSKKK